MKLKNFITAVAVASAVTTVTPAATAAASSNSSEGRGSSLTGSSPIDLAIIVGLPLAAIGVVVTNPQFAAVLKSYGIKLPF